MKVQIESNATSELEKAEKMLDAFKQCQEIAEQLKNQMRFLTTADVQKLTGLSMPTVLAIFNRPDFPVCDYGRNKIVFAPAFYEYFMKPVKQGDF